MELKLEVNPKEVTDQEPLECRECKIIITPAINKDYWALRVKVSKNQAIVAFPKFGTMGIGFQIEKENWNTNLPYTCETEVIYSHIKVNKGKAPKVKDCLAAIAILQNACIKLEKKSTKEI